MMVRTWLRIILLGVLLASVWNVPRATVAQEIDPPGLQPKHPSGPADELEAMRLPDPRQAGTRSPYALINVRFTPEGEGGSWSGELTIDRSEKLAILLIASESAAWQVHLTLPDGRQQTLAELSEQSGGKHEVTSIGMEEIQYPAELYTIYRAPSGSWGVTITTDRPPTDGFLVVSPESTYGLYSYLTTTALVEGQPIGFGAYLYDEPLPAEPAPPEKADQEPEPPATRPDMPSPLTEASLEGTIVVQAPGGEERILSLLDDGGNGDDEPRDGRAGMVLPALEPGMYRASVRLRGTLPDGTTIERTSEHIFPVLPASLSLTGQVSSRVIDEQRLGLSLEAESRAEVPPQALVYAEVWGTNASGALIPVGWTSGMVTPQGQAGGLVQLELEFDSRWLALAGATAPLALRQVRVQDPDTFVPLATADEMPIEAGDLPAGAFTDPERIDRSDPELRMGRRSEAQSRSAAQRSSRAAQPSRRAAGGTASVASGVQPIAFREPRSAAAARAGSTAVNSPLQQIPSEGIFLVHGYCSGTLWPQWEFDDGPTVEFSDTFQNRSHNQFAQLIDQQGDQAFSQAYTIVGHSQGGAAALHLYAYYWSGLDWSQAPRRIQSVGTPYWGTPLAGLLAWIGQVFGASCGANWNLTQLGAALWQASIPWWARNQVYYATTAHGNWWIFESICHASSFILSGIDDGVVSVWAGQLPGGNNLGMKRNWCHSAGMVYPRQYTDFSRNSEMDIYGRVSNQVGVIPSTGSCPTGQLVTIHMDDEDNNNANGRGGWIGATTSTNNTTFRFCRVPGSLFRALSTTNQPQRHYAVLKLGSVCPAGSVEFGRYFDNEDNNNQNWSSGPITPNVSTNNTTLRFCLFRAASTTMSAFPNLGFSYGVFAPASFSQALATGYVYTDDEDWWNANGYMAGSGWISDAQQIVSGGSNTLIRLARVTN
ncbi:MAG TPA: hypothetical protein VFZ66_23670 [Herpetosiphonaceae bacterium]